MTQKRPRTIQIFLPTGDPAGIRIAEQTTSIIRVIEVPRSDIAEFVKMPEAKQVGLYFLVSGDSKDELYIRQSGECGLPFGIPVLFGKTSSLNPLFAYRIAFWCFVRTRHQWLYPAQLIQVCALHTTRA